MENKEKETPGEILSPLEWYRKQTDMSEYWQPGDE